MLDKGLSPRSVQVAHRALNGALKQAVRWGLVARNVLEAVTVPKQIKPEIQVWTGEEILLFLAIAKPHRLYPLFYTALATGMRRSEIVGLRWCDVDLVNAKIHIRQTVVPISGRIEVREPKTAASKRSISISAEDVAVLTEHRERQAEERALVGKAWNDLDLVFPSQVGTYLHPRNLSRLFARLVEKAGVTEVGFHSLRHTHASLLIKNRVDAKVVSERLGHTNVAFTQSTYQKLYDEQRSQAALGLMNMLTKSQQAGLPN